MPALHDVSIRQLEYLVAVADTRGFHRAAERCHVSQPTLSAQVQQVEAVLGVQVFERDRRGVLVTPAGDEIVARARRILVEVRDLLDAAARARDPFSGTLRIGVIPTIAPYLLPALGPAVADAHPSLRLAFREEKTADVVRAIEQGRLDCGIVALEADLGGLAHAVSGEDAFVVALPKGHPLAMRKRLGVSDLEDQSVLLLDEGHCFRSQALALCSKVGASELDFRATSLPTLAQMVSAGMGITLLPSLAVPVENRDGQLDIRPFSAPAPHRTIALVWRPRSAMAEALTKLAGTMRRAIAAKAQPAA